MKSRGNWFSPVFAAALVAGCQPSDEKLASRYEGVVESYCLECHDAAGREAGLSLEGVDLDNIAAQKILNVAQWYIDQGHCWSARYYLERLEALYPQTTAAACGRRLYATLPANPPCPVECALVVARNRKIC